MSSRAVGGDEAGTTAAANHQSREQAVDRKPAVAPETAAMRFLATHAAVVPLVQQSPVVGPNVLKANLLNTGSLKTVSAPQTPVMFGVNSSVSLTLTRPPVPLQGGQTALVPRVTVSAAGSKSELSNLPLNPLSAVAAIASPVYRQAAAVAINKLQPIPSSQQQVNQPLTAGISYNLTAAVGLVRPNASASQTAIGMSVVRPVITGVTTVSMNNSMNNDAAAIARMIPVTSLMHVSSPQVPAAVQIPVPARTISQVPRIPGPAAGPSDLKAAAQSNLHGLIPRAPGGTAIVLQQPKSGGGIAIAKPAHLPALNTSQSLAAVPATTTIQLPAAIGNTSSTNVGIGLGSAQLGNAASRSVAAAVQRPQSGPGLSLVPANRPTMGAGQMWAVQRPTNTSMVIAGTTASSIVIQSTKSHDASGSASAVPIQLTAPRTVVTQQVRPQQVALIPQKALGSPAATAVMNARITEGSVVVGPGVLASTSRSASVINVAHAYAGNVSSVTAANLNQMQAINLSQNAKPPTIVLANTAAVQVPRLGAAPATTNTGSAKSSGQASALNLSQHNRQAKNLKPQPPGGLSPSTVVPVGYSNTTPLALNTSKPASKALTMGAGQAGSTAAGDATTASRSFSGQQMSVTNATVGNVTTAAIQLAQSNAAGYLVTAPAHTIGSGSLPVTLQPLVQTAESRQPSERVQLSQAFVGYTPYGNVTRPSAAMPGFTFGILSSSNNVSTASSVAGAIYSRNNHLLSVATAVSSVAAPSQSHFAGIVDAASRNLLVSDGLSKPGQSVSASMSKLPLSRPTTCASSDTASASGQALLSPRPGILRKRTHDLTRTPVKRSLHNILSPASGSALLSSSDVTCTLPVSPKSLDGSRESSRSSTDTASSVESSPPIPKSGSQSSNCRDRDETTSALASGFRSIPRKKPRKQSLRANEEPHHDGFSTDDEMDECSSDWPSLPYDKQYLLPQSNLRDSPLPSEYVDEEGVRYTLEDPQSSDNAVSIMGSYRCSWKPRAYHFNTQNDFKTKDERRPSVQELANQKGITQRASAWKLYMITSELESLGATEESVLDEVTAMHASLTPKKSAPSTRHCAATRSTDETTRAIGELMQANIQRCRHYIDQLAEAKAAIFNMVKERRPQALEIVLRHQSKRLGKKRERL